MHFYGILATPQNAHIFAMKRTYKRFELMDRAAPRQCANVFLLCRAFTQIVRAAT